MATFFNNTGQLITVATAARRDNLFGTLPTCRLPSPPVPFAQYIVLNARTKIDDGQWRRSIATP